MFGLPLWAVSLIVQILSKLGLFNLAERLALKAGIAVVDAIKNAKVERTYPPQRQRFSDPQQHAKGQENANFNRGDNT